MPDFSAKSLGVISLHASDNPKAQTHFCKGLLWCYGFHHEEASRCFEIALEHDHLSALAHWGIAYSIGPFYNRPWSWFTADQQEQVSACAHEALQTALQLCQKLDVDDQHPLIRELIEAYLLRYPTSDPADLENQARLLREHATAMQELAKRHENNLDVLALSCEAMMNCTPWQLWDIHSNIPAKDSLVLETINLLEQGLHQASESGIEHPGLLHLHVHAIEMSPEPAAALPSAEALRKLDSPCGHLIHMATHIDILVGDYANTVATNDLAIEQDLRIDRRQGEFYTISRLHNHHLKLFGAMMSGQYGAALQAQQAIMSTVTVEDVTLADDYLAISIEGFHANALHVAVRFGDWSGIVKRPPPAEPAHFLLSTAMHYYAQSVAYAALDNIEQADLAARHFKKAVGSIPDWHIVNNNPTQEILRIADQMQLGERLFRRSDYTPAFDALREATRLGDKLEYCEPWAWMHPPRHALGALLLERNKIEEALDVYETDLGINNRLPRALQHPNNIWALTGLYECLVKTGQQSRAGELEKQVSAAQAVADTDIRSSCCCRRLQ